MLDLMIVLVSWYIADVLYPVAQERFAAFHVPSSFHENDKVYLALVNYGITRVNSKFEVIQEREVNEYYVTKAFVSSRGDVVGRSATGKLILFQGHGAQPKAGSWVLCEAKDMDKKERVNVWYRPFDLGSGWMDVDQCAKMIEQGIEWAWWQVDAREQALAELDFMHGIRTKCYMYATNAKKRAWEKRSGFVKCHPVNLDGSSWIIGYWAMEFSKIGEMTKDELKAIIAEYSDYNGHPSAGYGGISYYVAGAKYSHLNDYSSFNLHTIARRNNLPDGMVVCSQSNSSD